MTLLLALLLSQPAIETCDLTGHCMTIPTANCAIVAQQINAQTSTRGRCVWRW
jgi:hypothetical protein